MPNHCETDLTISGPSHSITEIESMFFNDDGSLNCDAVIPYPEYFKELDRIAGEWEDTYTTDGFRLHDDSNTGGIIPTRPTDGFNAGGYEWCVNNWGTKWGTYRGEGKYIVSDPLSDVVSFITTFTSAWSPPIPVISRLAELYPDVTITMNAYECGAGFHMENTWIDGVLQSETEHRYDGERGG
jgi:hypothetical protein